MIRIWIDEKEIVTEEGKTILEIAKEKGIYIPTLCYHEHLLPIGSCRICIVEVEGYEKPQTSCNTFASHGMKIRTNSERLKEMRREFLKLLLMEHPLDCPQCDKAGHCKLQDLVYEAEIERAPYRFVSGKERLEPYATPLIKKWNKRCVLCLRCYHACLEISGRGVLDVKGKGFDAKIEVANPENCISCGECLAICPTGALTECLSPKKTRPWMSSSVKTVCSHCGFGCTLIVETQDSFVTKVESEEESLPNRGHLCVRGRFGYDYVNDERRLNLPLRRIYDEIKILSFDEAENEVIRHLKRIDEEGGSIGILMSPRITNEEAYLLLRIGQLFKKTLFSSSSYFGSGKIIKAMDEAGLPYGYDYDKVLDCDLFLIFGTDLLTENYPFGVKIRETVRKRGARVVVVNTAPTSFSGACDLWIKVDPGTEKILIDGIALNLLKENGFKKREIEGFVSYLESIKAYEKKDVAELCGIEERSLEKALELIKNSKKVGVIFDGSLSLKAIRSLLNLSILTDMELFPLSLQANAVGISRLIKDIVSPIDFLMDKGIKALIIYEEEPSLFLNEEFLKSNLREKELIVNFTFLPTPISSYAHLVFPSGSFAEKEGTYISGDGSIRRLKKAVEAPLDGLTILKDLFFKLNGKAIKEEEIVDFIEKSLEVEGKERKFLWNPPFERKKSGFKIFTKDLLRNPYLEYSRGIRLIEKDSIFISKEDAENLKVNDGEEIIIEDGRALLKKKVTILSGLKKGVLIAHPFEEKDVLMLFEEPGEEREVNIRKA